MLVPVMQSDRRKVTWMSDEVVLSNRFDILSDNPDLCSDADSQCLSLAQGFSRDDLQRSSSAN